MTDMPYKVTMFTDDEGLPVLNNLLMDGVVSELYVRRVDAIDKKQAEKFVRRVRADQRKPDNSEHPERAMPPVRTSNCSSELLRLMQDFTSKNDYGPWSSIELGALLPYKGYDALSASSALLILYRMGYVDREHDTVNPRAFVYRLTDKGLNNTKFPIKINERKRLSAASHSNPNKHTRRRPSQLAGGPGYPNIETLIFRTMKDNPDKMYRLSDIKKLVYTHGYKASSASGGLGVLKRYGLVEAYDGLNCLSDKGRNEKAHELSLRRSNPHAEEKEAEDEMALG